ncbi:ArsR family transcriptional regulator [Aquihabitans daechungensis]|uniref:arsenate reductase/protein-tyrosine-phosphatase family protein n=1 Tax=Aquihabitans daechungensis TaxID=1052257 RepID=UPI003BA09D9A
MATLELDPGPLGFLQLAGHPVRWSVLRHLARSDHTVRELTALAEEPQNLVSYHLGKLRGAGLVSSRRSSADGRDAYYRADLPRLASMLSDVGIALHPGLGTGRAATFTADVGPARILFLCTGNSARSQIAEALATERSGGAIDARSAGSRPKPLHPNAVRVLREEYGIDISGRRSKHLDAVRDERFDQVVTLCDRVREVCPELPGRPEAVHWSMPDPSEGDPDGDDDATYPAFRRTAADIDSRLGFLLATPRHPTPSTTTSSPTLEEP